MLKMFAQLSVQYGIWYCDFPQKYSIIKDINRGYMIKGSCDQKC